MKIHFLCNDGSPIGVTTKTIFGEDGRAGVGGAELALLTLCDFFYRRGDEVVLYNDPRVPDGSLFEQRMISDFNPNEDRDVLIIFRSPNHLSYNAKGLKVWLSCDQMTVGDFREFARSVDKIVTISKFHTDFFKSTYGIENSIPIDLPIRVQDYKIATEKVPYRCIFTSIPDRGLMCLNAAWPMIVKEVPEASLVITSDWRLWVDWASDENIRHFKQAFQRQENVIYHGAINRKKLIEYQLGAQVHLYPCIYEELFCLSVAESQVAGVYPITSNYGALTSTNMAMKLVGNPEDPKWIELFVDRAVHTLKNQEKLLENQKHLRALATKRFSPETILRQWDEKVFSIND